MSRGAAMRDVCVMQHHCFAWTVLLLLLPT